MAPCRALALLLALLLLALPCAAVPPAPPVSAPPPFPVRSPEKQATMKYMQIGQFWKLLGSCSSRSFLPLQSEEDKIEVPAHGTAVVTVTHLFRSNEQHTWHRYYSSHFGAENIFFVLDINGHCEVKEQCAAMHDGGRFAWSFLTAHMLAEGSRAVAGGCDADDDAAAFAAAAVNELSQHLRALGYTKIIAVQDDEFLVPDPEKYPGGLGEYAAAAEWGPEGEQRLWARARSFVVREADGEPRLSRKQPIFSQRGWWRSGDPQLCRTALTAVPGTYDPSNRAWKPDDDELEERFGEETENTCFGHADPDLVLASLKCVDKHWTETMMFRAYDLQGRQFRQQRSRQDPEFRSKFEELWTRNAEECGYTEDVDEDCPRHLVRIPQKYVIHAGV